MAVELAITVKNEEKRQTLKHLVYENFVCSIEDVYINSLVEDAVKQFNAEPDDITIKIVMVIK